MQKEITNLNFQCILQQDERELLNKVLEKMWQVTFNPYWDVSNDTPLEFVRISLIADSIEQIIDELVTRQDVVIYIASKIMNQHFPLYGKEQDATIFYENLMKDERRMVEYKEEIMNEYNEGYIIIEKMDVKWL